MLNWMRRYVLSTRCDDYIFYPACDLQTEILIKVASVAGVKVTFTVKGFLVETISLEITHEHISTLDTDLTGTFFIRVEDFN